MSGLLCAIGSGDMSQSGSHQNDNLRDVILISIIVLFALIFMPPLFYRFVISCPFNSVFMRFIESFWCCNIIGEIAAALCECARICVVWDFFSPVVCLFFKGALVSYDERMLSCVISAFSCAAPSSLSRFLFTSTHANPFFLSFILPPRVLVSPSATILLQTLFFVHLFLITLLLNVIIIICFNNLPDLQRKTQPTRIKRWLNSSHFSEPRT